MVDLEKISIQVGLNELRVKIQEIKRSNIEYLANESIVYNIFKDNRFKDLLDPSVTLNFTKNLMFYPFFSQNFMGIKQDVEFNGKNATMLCAGSLYEDYEKFFNNIKYKQVPFK